MTPVSTPAEIEAENDRLAREHPIDDYYARSPAVVRFIEARRLALVRELADVRPGMRVLEVGVGGGHVLGMFRHARLVGVDVSRVVLETAKKNLAGCDVELRQGELAAQGFAAGSFERILCSEVLEHVVRPDELLAEMARLLAPGGRAVVTVPNDPLILEAKRWLRRAPLRWALRGTIDWGGDAHHLHRWRPREFEAVLARHFEVVARRAAPFDHLPVRACFACTLRRGEG